MENKNQENSTETANVNKNTFSQKEHPSIFVSRSRGAHMESDSIYSDNSLDLKSETNVIDSKLTCIAFNHIHCIVKKIDMKIKLQHCNFKTSLCQ